MMRLENPYGLVRHFWERAFKLRGVILGPDENVTFDVTDLLQSPTGDFIIDGWWMKGYGKNAPHRHSRRRIEARELYSKERLYDVMLQVTEEIVLELFPVLPRNGRWRLFNRRPRCKV